MTTLAPPQPARSLPPGPRTPKTLQTAAYVTRNVAWCRRLQQRYGDVFTLRIHGFPPIVVIAEPELIRQVFAGDPERLHAGTGSPLGSILGANSLLTIDEDLHLRQRRLLLPPFRGDRMRPFEAVTIDVTNAELDQVTPGVPFGAIGMLQRITLRVILRTIFGAHGEAADRLERLLPRTMDLGARLMMLRFAQVDLGGWSPWGRFLRLRAEVDAICLALIAQARADPALAERADVLALLIRATHEDGSPMADREILDQLLTLMLAGFETTAATIGWSLERLSRTPAVLGALQASVRAGEGDLLDAVFDETLRTRPAVNFAVRSVQREPYELAGHLLPLQTRIACNPALTHNDPRLFERPGEFLPERFLAARPSNAAFIPFGGGRRRCIGAAFARMEATAVLRTILERFDLAATNEPDEPWGFRGVTFVPGRGARVTLTPAAG